MFKISQEEHLQFDNANDIRVNEFVRENREVMTPYPTSSLGKLRHGDPLVTKITM